MKNLGSLQKRAWLLFAYRATTLPVIKLPMEIFDNPETCFKKYPGTWKGSSKSFYYLKDLNKFEKFQELDCIYLEIYPFTQETDVTE